MQSFTRTHKGFAVSSLSTVFTDFKAKNILAQILCEVCIFLGAREGSTKHPLVSSSTELFTRKLILTWWKGPMCSQQCVLGSSATSSCDSSSPNPSQTHSSNTPQPWYHSLLTSGLAAMDGYLGHLHWGSPLKMQRTCHNFWHGLFVLGSPGLQS